MGTISIRPNDTTANQIELIQQRHRLGTAAKAVTLAVDRYLDALADAERWKGRHSQIAATAAELTRAIEDRHDANQRINEARHDLSAQLNQLQTPL